MKKMKMMSSPFQDFILYFLIVLVISPFTPKHQSASSPYFSPYVS